MTNTKLTTCEGESFVADSSPDGSSHARYAWHGGHAAGHVWQRRHPAHALHIGHWRHRRSTG